MTDRERLRAAVETMTEAEAGAALRTLAGASDDLVAWIHAHSMASDQGRHTTLFVEHRPPLDELLSQQGVDERQGLDAVTDDEWAGDEADERYLAALSDET
jgi:hypothetical protein